jgi:hypothetical protein
MSCSCLWYFLLSALCFSCAATGADAGPSDADWFQFSSDDDDMSARNASSYLLLCVLLLLLLLLLQGQKHTSFT